MANKVNQHPARRIVNREFFVCGFGIVLLLNNVIECAMTNTERRTCSLFMYLSPGEEKVAITQIEEVVVKKGKFDVFVSLFFLILRVVFCCLVICCPIKLFVY